MKLMRADTHNGLFSKIEEQWSAQCAQFGAQFDEYASPSINHAKEIAAGKLETNQYGIYVLENEEEYELIAHINTARLPGTIGVTLRVVWVLMAPKYDYVDVEGDVLAHIGSALFSEAIFLAKGIQEPQMRADHIKVHLTGMADRRFFAGLAFGLQGSDTLTDVAIRGNWLHMTAAWGATEP